MLDKNIHMVVITKLQIQIYETTSHARNTVVKSRKKFNFHVLIHVVGSTCVNKWYTFFQNCDTGRWNKTAAVERKTNVLMPTSQYFRSAQYILQKMTILIKSYTATTEKLICYVLITIQTWNTHTFKWLLFHNNNLAQQFLNGRSIYLEQE